MCTVVLPPGFDPTAFDKYIILYHTDMYTAGYPEMYILTLYQVPEGASITETLGSINSVADSGIA